MKSMTASERTLDPELSTLDFENEPNFAAWRSDIERFFEETERELQEVIAMLEAGRTGAEGRGSKAESQEPSTLSAQPSALPDDRLERLKKRIEEQLRSAEETDLGKTDVRI